MVYLFLGCAAPADPCADDGALSTCLVPIRGEAWYVDQASLYFDTLESDYSGAEGPAYADGVARWEWPPWLLLTGYGRDDMEAADALMRLIPTSVPTRDCRFFEVSPFARCRVDFRYEDHPDAGCPIYEEFTFDDDGEMTFIEAWSDQPGLLPVEDPVGDAWAEGVDAHRLSTRLPGLGNARGEIDLDSPWMQAAAEEDPEVADFVARANDFQASWLEAYDAAGDEVFAAGCGW
jgi:hypothetical protein